MKIQQQNILCHEVTPVRVCGGAFLLDAACIPPRLIQICPGLWEKELKTLANGSQKGLQE